MARLPTPGGDDGTWGSILNDFLSVAHNSDGSVKLDTDGTLAANSDTKIASQKAVKTYVDNTVSAGAPDADGSTKGIIQLAGDLSGTAASPQIATGAIVNADVNDSAAIAQSKIANLTSDLENKQDISGDLTIIAGLSPNEDDILQRKSSNWTSRSMNELKTDLSLTKSDVGLGNVDNTSDATKNSASATLTNKTLTSPVIDTSVSGTAIDTDNTLAADSDTKLASQKATKAYVDNSVSDLQTAIVADVLANRGTAAAAGNGGLFYATDSEQLFRSDGADWSAVAAAADGSTRRVGKSTAPASDTTISTATTMSLAGGGLTVSGTTNGGKIRIEFEAIVLNGTTPPSQLLYISMFQDGGSVGLKAINPAPLTVTSSGSSPVNSVTVTRQNQLIRMVWELDSAPSAGAHSWEAILGSTHAVSSTIIGAGGAPPAILSVYEIAE